MATKLITDWQSALKCEALALMVPEAAAKDFDRGLLAVDKWLDGALARLFADAPFKGEAEKLLVHHPARLSGPKKIIFIGTGAKLAGSEEMIRRAAAHATRAAGDAATMAFVLPGGEDVGRGAEAAVTGHRLGRYRFDRFKNRRADKPEPPPRQQEFSLVVPESKQRTRAATGARTGDAVADGVELARDLGNLPANHCQPAVLAKEAQQMARADHLRCQVLDRRQMERLGMGSLLSVARGSDEPPRFIVLEYGHRAPGVKTVCVLGKAITFDSGGISIKPAQDMDKMRYDKCGGCAVIGLFRTLARIKPRIHVVGLVPASENMLGGSATKPGDLVRAMNGKSIEVLNTDAEGRLVLADALCYAQRYNPDHIIDLATLTGACVMTFGSHVSAVIGTDDALIKRLFACGEATGERIWQLPLYDEYEHMIRGTYGDLKNIGGPKGGTITAAAFLKAFAGGKSWAHLDIAGTAYDDPARVYHHNSGATGVGVRLLTRFLTELAAESAPAARRAKRK